MTSNNPSSQGSDLAVLIGTVLAGRYRLTRDLGSGATTAIFDAVDEETGQEVTFKLIRPRLAAVNEFRDRFDEAMRGAADLRHPNIAIVYDFGYTAVATTESAYVVTERLTGGSLRDLFDRGRRLTPSQALVVGLDACRALDVAHRRNQVHGELVPSKIVFGDDRRLRIVDFGLSRLIGRLMWTDPSNVPNHVAGYASPEQAVGQRVTGKSDVYSLALTLTEAITGSLPFKAESTTPTLAARVGRLLPVTADMGPLASVLEHAARPDVEDRSTAAEFGKNLVQIATRLPRPEPLPLLSAAPPKTADGDDRSTGNIAATGNVVAAGAPVVGHDDPRSVVRPPVESADGGQADVDDDRSVDDGVDVDRHGADVEIDADGLDLEDGFELLLDDDDFDDDGEAGVGIIIEEFDVDEDLVDADLGDDDESAADGDDVDLGGDVDLGDDVIDAESDDLDDDDLDDGDLGDDDSGGRGRPLSLGLFDDDDDLDDDDLDGDDDLDDDDLDGDDDLDDDDLDDDGDPSGDYQTIDLTGIDMALDEDVDSPDDDDGATDLIAAVGRVDVGATTVLPTVGSRDDGGDDLGVDDFDVDDLDRDDLDGDDFDLDDLDGDDLDGDDFDLDDLDGDDLDADDLDGDDLDGDGEAGTFGFVIAEEVAIFDSEAAGDAEVTGVLPVTGSSAGGTGIVPVTTVVAYETGAIPMAAADRGETGAMPAVVTDAAPPADLASTDDDSPSRPRRRSFPWKTLIGSLIILGLVVVALVAFRLLSTPKYVVPDLAGRPIAEAQSLIAPNGWDVRLSSERSAEFPTPDVVVRTNPGPNAELAQGEPFEIVVSEGPIQVELPDLTGVDYQEAQSRLQQLGMVVTTERGNDDTIEKDAVIRWYVPGDESIGVGSLVDPGTTIILVVSDGPAPRAVPDLVGTPLAEATAILEQLGLTLTIESRQPNVTLAVDTVVSQSTAAGTEVERGTAIGVVVSELPTEAVFPDLSVYTDYESMKAAVEAAGFTTLLQLGDGTGSNVVYTIDGEVPEAGQVFELGTEVRFETS